MIFFISDKFETFQQKYFIKDAIVSSSKNLDWIKKQNGEIIFDGEASSKPKIHYQSQTFKKDFLEICFSLLLLNIFSFFLFKTKPFSYLFIFSWIFLFSYLLIKLINPAKKYQKYFLELEL